MPRCAPAWQRQLRLGRLWLARLVDIGSIWCASAEASGGWSAGRAGAGLGHSRGGALSGGGGGGGGGSESAGCLGPSHRPRRLPSGWRPALAPLELDSVRAGSTRALRADLGLNLADRLLKREPLAGNVGFVERGFDAAELRDQRRARTLIKRTAAVAGVLVETGNGAAQ